MKTVLHLERKFVSKTETFIINQVNTIKNFNVVVATAKSLNNFLCNKKIIEPKNKSLLVNGKILFPQVEEDLLSQLNEYKIDLIHVHYLVDALYFLNMVKKFNVPKVVSCYGYDVSSFPNKLLGIPKLLLKKVFNEYDYFIAMSPDMKLDLIKLCCPEGKIIIHYYGTDVERFVFNERNYLPKDKIIILSVGTVEKKKAQHLVIEALGIVSKVFTNFEYHIVGSGDYINICKRNAKKLGIYNNVFFHGYIPYNSPLLQEFYNEADIFILPSITLHDYDKEGIPGTIVEAMASGLPVISTYHAGIPYIIESGKEGILVKERDIMELVDALMYLIKNPDLRQKLGQNAQNKALEELDLKKGTERLEKIYTQIINNHNN